MDRKVMPPIEFEDLKRAVDDLATIPYFPAESRASVMDFLAKICPHYEALRWLVDTALNRVTKWPALAEIRGLLCTKYDARDGIDAPCNLPGYSAEEAMNRHLEKHEQLKAGSWEADRLTQLGLGAGKQLKRLEGGK